MMKEFFWEATKIAEETYRVTWYATEDQRQSRTEVTHKDVRVTGQVEDIRVNLAFAAIEVRKENSQLFIVEMPEEMRMMMEGEDVQH